MIEQSVLSFDIIKCARVTFEFLGPLEENKDFYPQGIVKGMPYLKCLRFVWFSDQQESYLENTKRREERQLSLVARIDFCLKAFMPVSEMCMLKYICTDDNTAVLIIDSLLDIL